MDFNFLSESELTAAKARIWSRMESRLHPHEFMQDAPVLDALATAEVPVNALHKVRMKEQLLDKLPAREVAPYFKWVKRGFAMSTLAMVFGVLFVPVLDGGGMVLANTVNQISVVQGEVWVNGSLVEGEVLLNAGDQIRTGQGGMAHLTFMDDSRMSLSQNSQLDLVESNEMSIVARQLSGDVWVQALNLMDSSLVLQFPEGQVQMDQRGSFNVSVSESETVLEVASNLVNVDIATTQMHRGVLGQGARLVIGDSLTSETIASEYKQEDLWWSYNISYGKIHARSVDERYHNERIQYAKILPGSPFYALKTFREEVQVALAFTQESRNELLVQHAENRLVEAQVLLSEGEVEAAETVLTAYQEKVDEVVASGDETQKQAVQDLIEDNQKIVMAKDGNEEGVELLEDHLGESAAVVATEEEKESVQMLTASQKLQRIPELVEAGDYEKALAFLSDYAEQSRSILVQLEEVPLEEREAKITELLERKTKDLHLLRMIASMPELSGAVDVDAQVYGELSMMVMSLRERTLKHLDDFFAQQEEGQAAVYERLKGGTEISEDLEEQLNEMEAELDEVTVTEEALVDLEVQPVIVDPRFVD